MPNTVKRLNYYDHQFLRAPDFTDEQSYHLNLRRLHNSLLHTWGIAQGLQVTLAGGGGTAVTVGAGVAIDSLGREIVLSSDVNLDLGVGPEATFNITIAYDEQQTDATTEAGGPGQTRVTEQPNLSFSQTAPAVPSMTLILAKVLRTAAGLGAIDLSDRRAAGVVVSPDLAVNSLTLKKDGVLQTLWPKLSCSGANQAALANGSLSLDAQREIFFVDGGQIRSLDQNHKIVFNRSQNLLELYEFGDIRFLTGPSATEKMRVMASGNVGIGTPNPDRNLSVTGTGAAGTYANIKNASHELLIGVDTAAILSAMTASDLQIRTNNVTRMVVAQGDGNTRIQNTLTVGPYPLPTAEGRFAVTGSVGEVCFAKRTLTAWPAAAGAGNRFVWYNPDGSARLYTDVTGDLLTVAANGTLTTNADLRLGNSDIYFTKTNHTHTGFGNTLGLAAIENDGGIYNALMILGRTTGANSGPRIVKLWDFLQVNGSPTQALEVNGRAISSTGWATTSDMRLKKNISPLSGALDKLLSLRGVSFDWKEPEKYGAGNRIGLIAQEVEKVFPEWVGVDSAGFKSLASHGLEALMIESFRELKEENKALKAAVAELQSKLGIEAKDQKSADTKAADYKVTKPAIRKPPGGKKNP